MSGEGINPFNFNDPAASSDLIDRKDELKAIMNLVWSGNNTRIAAPRRMGKTSLLLAVEKEADQQGFVPVHIDFYGAVSIGEITSKIAGAYTASLSGRLRQLYVAAVRTFNPKFRVGGSIVPVGVDLSFAAATPMLTELLNMPKRIHDRTGKRCLIVFDEFQVVMDVGETAALIRSVIQHHRDAASYVFAGSNVGMMRSLFADKRMPFYTQAAAVSLPPLQADDLGEYIGRKFEETGKDPGEGFAPLLDAASGHPQRAMLLAYHLWDRTPPGGVSTEETWTEALDAASLSVIDEFKRAWDDSTPTARRVLTVIADNDIRLYSADGGVSRSGGSTRTIKALIDRGDVVEDQGRVDQLPPRRPTLRQLDQGWTPANAQPPAALIAPPIFRSFRCSG
jgi:hypothetical protein